LGIAIHGYITQSNVLPAQTTENIALIGGKPVVVWWASWTAGLLPHIEQSVLFNAVNFQLPMLEMNPPIYGANTTVALISINTLICPSDSVSRPPTFAFAGNSFGYTGQFAVINYAGNYGGPAMFKACSGTIIPAKGKNNVVFSLMTQAGVTPPATGGPVTVQSITDGLTSTALFSEHLLAASDFMGAASPVTPGPGNGRRGLYQVAYSVVLDQASQPNAQAFVAACKGLPGTTPAVSQGSFGTQWLLSADFATANNAYTHVMTPNSSSCTGTPDASGFIANSTWGGIGAAITATSNHPGGVHVGFADGSVKFVKEAVDLQTWWALGTRNGREVISSDAF
jgi:prepilin-type processing-associated H-X9-DG protein